MASRSIREGLSTAMQLQRRRCEVYHLWESKFKCVTEGSLTVGDFDKTIQTVVVKEFQSVSVALRALSHEVQQALEGEASPLGNRAAAAWSEDEVRLAKVLLEWVDELQDVERDHYNTTIECFKWVATHTAPNVRRKTNPAEHSDGAMAETPPQPSSTSSAAAAPAVGSCAAEAVKKGIASHAVPSIHSSTQEPQQQLHEGKPALVTAPAAPAPPPQPTPEEYSVHDAERCALRRLYPQHVLTKLFFVDCRVAFDSLANTGEHEDDQMNEAALGDPRQDASTQPLVRSTEAFQRARTAEEKQSLLLGHYDAAAVAQACQQWSTQMERLLAKRHALEQAARELVEDLQCDLSDLLQESL